MRGPSVHAVACQIEEIEGPYNASKWELSNKNISICPKLLSAGDVVEASGSGGRERRISLPETANPWQQPRKPTTFKGDRVEGKISSSLTSVSVRRRHRRSPPSDISLRTVAGVLEAACE